MEYDKLPELEEAAVDLGVPISEIEDALEKAGLTVPKMT